MSVVRGSPFFGFFVRGGIVRGVFVAFVPPPSSFNGREELHQSPPIEL